MAIRYFSRLRPAAAGLIALVALLAAGVLAGEFSAGPSQGTLEAGEPINITF